jgi:hypothetical protein
MTVVGRDLASGGIGTRTFVEEQRRMMESSADLLSIGFLDNILEFTTKIQSGIKSEDF